MGRRGDRPPAPHHGLGCMGVPHRLPTVRPLVWVMALGLAGTWATHRPSTHITRCLAQIVRAWASRVAGVRRAEEEAQCSSTRRSKGKNAPAVGKRSRAIRPVTIISGITVLVSKRAQERCNAPTNSLPASAWCLRTPAPRRSNAVKKCQRGGWGCLTDEHLTATAPVDNSPAASPCSTRHKLVSSQAWSCAFNHNVGSWALLVMVEREISCAAHRLPVEGVKL